MQSYVRCASLAVALLEPPFSIFPFSKVACVLPPISTYHFEPRFTALPLVEPPFSMTISDDIGEQTAQCLRNIESALTEAGASMRDVVRVHYILPNATDFAATWPALRTAFGEVRPAATMFEAKLADPRMKIEIEVDAIIGSA